MASFSHYNKPSLWPDLATGLSRYCVGFDKVVSLSKMISDMVPSLISLSCLAFLRLPSALRKEGTKETAPIHILQC